MMANSSGNAPLGIARSAAVMSLGLVALAGSITTSLCRRTIAALTRSDTSAPRVSRLVLDEWEADLSRLNLPSKRDVEVTQQQLAGLEAQIDQLIQRASQSKESN